MTGLILTIIAAVLLLGAVSGFYFFRLALDRRSNKKSALRALSKDTKKTDNRTSFLERSACESWYIDSFDGLKLHAFFIENSSDRFVIIQHGYMSRAKHMEKTAEFFYNEGFGVLIPDARAHGESEGKYIGMGWNDRLDILSWAAKLSAERPNSMILLYGISMGASAVMMLAGEDIPPQIKGMIEDCGYSSIWAECRYQLTKFYHLPVILAEYILFWSNIYTNIFAKYDLRMGDAAKSLNNTKLPIIFIHGCEDSFVPFYMLDIVFRAAGTSKKRKYSFPNAEHERSASSDGDRYASILREFICEIFQNESSNPIGQ